MSYQNPYFPEATLTPDIYWANQPPAVRALRNLSPEDVGGAAKQLSDQGFLIDVPIMVYQWDPVTVMGLRRVWGYTWVPSGAQANVPVVPGLVVPGMPEYDPKNAPANSIKVSIDAADYPPFDPPPPPLPPPSTALVGTRIWANVFTFAPGARDVQGNFMVNDGQQITQDGASYVAHRSTTLMGETLYFTRTS